MFRTLQYDPFTVTYVVWYMLAIINAKWVVIWSWVNDGRMDSLSMSGFLNKPSGARSSAGRGGGTSRKGNKKRWSWQYCSHLLAHFANSFLPHVMSFAIDMFSYNKFVVIWRLLPLLSVSRAAPVKNKKWYFVKKKMKWNFLKTFSLYRGSSQRHEVAILA